MSCLDNQTWAKQGIEEEFDHNGHEHVWIHPHVSVFVILSLFSIMKVRGGKILKKKLEQKLFCVFTVFHNVKTEYLIVMLPLFPPVSLCLFFLVTSLPSLQIASVL